MLMKLQCALVKLYILSPAMKPLVQGGENNVPQHMLLFCGSFLLFIACAFKLHTLALYCLYSGYSNGIMDIKYHILLAHFTSVG